MYTRLLKPSSVKSFFLFGPRGTGKTTWIKHSFPDSIYIDLLESANFNDLLASPQRLANFIPPHFKGWVIIDEVQRVPEILNEVHRLIELSKFRFILTGSSPRKLKKKGQNLLAGRALTYHFYPLTAGELSLEFKLEHSLKFGHLPCAYTEPDQNKYLESYVSTYLEEEIRHEGITRNLSVFSRFLEAASFSQGSILNISEVSRECAVERKTVEHYFNILEELLISYRIPVFAKRAKRRLVLHPKFYFFDVGVYRTLRPMGPLDSPEEVEGAAYETLLLQELIAVNALYGLGYKIHYWRVSDGTEVDFVLYGKQGLLCFEIKRTGKIKSQHLKGLKSFKKDYPMAKQYFIYGGEKRQYIDGINVLPFKDTLQNLSNILR